MLKKNLIVLILLAVSSPSMAWMEADDPDVDEVLNTEDNQFAFKNGPGDQREWLYNNGGRTVIRVKGYDDPSAMKWDLSGYEGLVIEEAELHLCRANDDAINALVVSTINTDWTEGTQTGGTALNGEPCWRWRSYPDGEWTYIGSDFSTASFGNFGTLVSFGYQHNDTFVQYESGGREWIKMKLDPSIIYAMILDNYGVVVTDPRFGLENGNPTIYSSEQNASVQPRLYIKVASQSDSNAPGDVTDLDVQPGEWNGEAVLSFVAPDADDPDEDRAFGYRVRYATHGDFYGATDVDRWRIPRPGEPGTTDRVFIEDLTPGTSYNFWVQAYDRVGNPGNISVASLTLPGAISLPSLKQGQLPAPDPSGKEIAGVAGVLNYWACSELAKVNPLTGNRHEDGYTQTGDDNYKKANVVWDSSTNTVTLRPVRNQVVGFQLIIERLLSNLTGITITADNLNGPDGATIDASQMIEFFKLHYVGSETQYPDPAIPLSPPFSQNLDIPSINNPQGTFQGIWCDIYIPRGATPGNYTGTITVDCNELDQPVDINLEVIVASPVIPDRPTFLLDLNGYGNKWESTDSRYQIFQLCHKHRMVPNTLPYGYRDTSWIPDRAPELTGSGPATQISSWSTFADTYGPFFDGSAFSPAHATYPYHGPGEETPIANFYTTGFEGWPVSISDTAYGYDEISGGLGHAYWNSLVDSGGADLQRFWLEAPDVMEAFPDGFSQGVKNVWQEFAQYAQENNWTTAFQFYLNNKRDYPNTSSLWTLEEQYTADDFRAGAWFMGLCRQGWEAAGTTDTNFHWRTDTSARWQQNWGQLKGICNLRVQGDGRDWDYRQDRYRRYTEQTEESRWWYGTGPDRRASLTEHGAQILKHWSHGLNGGTPYWDNFKNNWSTATGNDQDGQDATLSVLLSGDSVPGYGTFDGRIATVRMKAMRYGQQLCELLNLMAGKDDWNRNIMARTLSAAFGDSGDPSGDGDGHDTFGGDEYTNMEILDYYQLHADLVASLAAGVEVGKEAEDFDTRTGKFVVGDDPEASEEQYMWAPNGSGNRWNGPDAGQRLEYSFTVEQEGSYRIKGRVYAPNGNDDSFWVRVDGEPSGGYLWEVLQNTEYLPDYVSDRGGEDPVQVCLTAGTHTVSVYLREDGTRLDTIGLELARSGSCF